MGRGRALALAIALAIAASLCAVPVLAKSVEIAITFLTPPLFLPTNALVNGALTVPAMVFVNGSTVKVVAINKLPITIRPPPPRLRMYIDDLGNATSIQASFPYLNMPPSLGYMLSATLLINKSAFVAWHGSGILIERALLTDNKNIEVCGYAVNVSIREAIAAGSYAPALLSIYTNTAMLPVVGGGWIACMNESGALKVPLSYSVSTKVVNGTRYANVTVKLLNTSMKLEKPAIVCSRKINASVYAALIKYVSGGERALVIAVNGSKARVFEVPPQAIQSIICATTRRVAYAMPVVTKIVVKSSLWIYAPNPATIKSILSKNAIEFKPAIYLGKDEWIYSGAEVMNLTNVANPAQYISSLVYGVVLVKTPTHLASVSNFSIINVSTTEMKLSTVSVHALNLVMYRGLKRTLMTIYEEIEVPTTTSTVTKGAWLASFRDILIALGALAILGIVAAVIALQKRTVLRFPTY